MATSEIQTELLRK